MSLSKHKGAAEADGIVEFTKLGENDYRRIIMQLQNEIVATNARLKGVQALTGMLHESEEQCRRLDEKANNFEMSLKRAEARIAQLNKLHGIGPQTAFNRGVVMPGVSKKDFDSVTQENIKLKKALEHIVAANLGGPQVILKNRELYDLVSALRDDFSRSEDHIKELEAALRGRDDGLAVVPELTKKVMKLERSLNAKQVFCETLMKENDRLKKANEEMGTSERQQRREEDQDSTDGSNQERERRIQENTALKEEMDKLLQDNSMLKDRFEEMQRILSDCKEKIKSLEEEKQKLAKQASELATIQRERQQENQWKTKLTNENTELKKKCDGFFQQVMSLNSKQKESEEELERMKRAFDHQKAELEEKKAMIHLMTESLKSYEDDFRRENEEKAKIQKMLDKSQQETDRTKRENQSHMATIRHLEDEFERMSKMLTEERKKSKNTSYGVTGGIFGNQPIAAAGARSLFMDTRQPIAVADGGTDESDGNKPKDPYSMPTTKSETTNAPSLIECPYCSRSYPYHLIEGHVQDCMEDSLYMDEKDY